MPPPWPRPLPGHTPSPQVLFRSYFTDGKNIASDIVLGGILAEVGLNVERAMARLSDSTAVREFEEAVKDAQRKGRRGLP